MVPFFSTTLFTGPAAHALGGADISPLVGLPVSALLYRSLMRGADLSAERDAIALDPQHLSSLHGRATVPVSGTVAASS